MNTSSRWIKVALTLTILALIFGGGWFYRVQDHSLQQEMETDLSAVVRLKARQLAAWREDRLADAAVLMENPRFIRGVARLQVNPRDEDAPEIRALFESLSKHHGYADIVLVDPDGRVRLSLSGQTEVNATEASALAVALRDRKPVLTELHSEVQMPTPHLSVVAPLFLGDKPAWKAVGAVILFCDASHYLYPLVQSWPTPTKTAETLLVRRDGDNVLFLNDLRYGPATALKLRIPLSRTEVPAVMAVLGHEGVKLGKDYRGVDVVSVLMPIPNSPWFMVAKMDTAEIFAEWRLRSVLILALLMGLAGLTVVLGLVFRQREQKKHYRELYRSELALRKSVERHSITLKAIGDAVISTDALGRVELLNPQAETLTGWSDEEARGRPLGEIFRIVNEHTRAEVENPVERVLREGVVVGLANHTVLIAKDGAEHPIADSGAPVRADGETIIGVVLVFRDQSVERAAAETLRDSEKRYRRLFESAKDGILILDFDTGKVVDVNPFLLLLLGYSHDALRGKHIWEIGAFNNTATSREAFKVLQDGEYIRYDDLPLETLDGRRIDVEFVSNVYLVDHTKVIQCNIRDITERKQAEEAAQNALREATRHSREMTALLDGAQAVMRYKGFEPAARAIFDVCKKIVGATSGYVALLTADGAENEVLFLDSGGSSCTVDPALPMPIRGLRREAYSKGEPVFHNAFPVSRFQKFLPEGHVPLESVLFAPMVVDGKAVGVIGLANKPEGFNENDARLTRAYSELSSIAFRNNQSFDALKKSEERLDLAIRSANMGVWSWSIDEDKRYFDDQVCHVLGIDRATFSGEAEEFFRVVHPDDHETIRAAMRRALDEDVPYETEYRAIRRDGSVHYIKARGKLHRDQIGRPKELNGVIMDVTEQKRAEEERDKLRAQFSQAQKMESVGRLAGGVAHDFNNMLGVILGHSEMAMEQIDSTHPLHADLQEIEKAAKRSADLTRQLLAFARRQTISPKTLDLSETVEGMLKMLRRLIGEDIDLAWLPANNLWPVKVDPGQIDQILANLCVNARDAISGIGKITIETSNVTFDEAYCDDHAGAIAGNYALLAVSDNGCGMNKETMDNIFEPFYTTKALGEGTGLGLATVYGIVKQNNGFINVYSEPARGTTFKIYLPRAEEQTREKPPAHLKKDLRGGETVLLVEDEEPLLALGKAILQRHGYEVLATNSPAEALAIARSHPGPIHLLLTDVVMPEMNGKDLRDRLAQLKSGFKSIFMSGYTANVIAHHGILDGDINFLQKPFSVQTLLEKVRWVLDG